MTDRANAGRIAGITIYPVKGMRGVDVSAAPIRPWGLEHDRLWAVVERSGRVLTQRVLPGMARVVPRVTAGALTLACAEAGEIEVAFPGQDAERIEVGVWGDVVDAARAGRVADRWLSQVLGVEARLAYMDRPASIRPVDPDWGRDGDTVSFADGFPILACTTASLTDLNERMPGAGVPMNRFRPTVTIENDSPWTEQSWSSLACGDLIFDAPKACTRCSVIGVDQVSGTRAELDPLPTLIAFRRDDKGRPLFGVNLIPRSAGVLRVGCAVHAHPDAFGEDRAASVAKSPGHVTFRGNLA